MESYAPFNFTPIFTAPVGGVILVPVHYHRWRLSVVKQSTSNAISVFQRDGITLAQFHNLVGGASLAAGVCGAVFLVFEHSFGIAGLLFAGVLAVFWTAIRALLMWRNNVMTLICTAHVPEHVKFSVRVKVRLLGTHQVSADNEPLRTELTDGIVRVLWNELIRNPDYIGGLSACTQSDHSRLLAHLDKSQLMNEVLRNSRVTLVDAEVLEVSMCQVPWRNSNRRRSVGLRRTPVINA